MSKSHKAEKDLLDCFSFRGDDFQENSAQSYRRLPSDSSEFRRFVKRHTRRSARRLNNVLCQEDSE
jgi:hypothetical protein